MSDLCIVQRVSYSEFPVEQLGYVPKKQKIKNSICITHLFVIFPSLCHVCSLPA